MVAPFNVTTSGKEFRAIYVRLQGAFRRPRPGQEGRGPWPGCWLPVIVCGVSVYGGRPGVRCVRYGHIWGMAEFLVVCLGMVAVGVGLIVAGPGEKWTQYQAARRPSGSPVPERSSRWSVRPWSPSSIVGPYMAVSSGLGFLVLGSVLMYQQLH